MPESSASKSELYAGRPAANYERYFVPAIGAPVAEELMRAAQLRPGERVLDVACGTGTVARLAAERVGPSGSVIGLDVNSDMLEVARAATPGDMSIDWREASAEGMPLPDEVFDVVLCQMGLQFFSDKAAGLREMYRVLAPGGRLVLNLPGPTPIPMAMMADGLARHASPEASSFVHIVFSLHDEDEIRRLVSAAGFARIDVRAADKELRLPPPADFLWQYVHSTPLAGLAAQMTEEQRLALEGDVCGQWQPLVQGEGLPLHVRMVTVTGAK